MTLGQELLEENKRTLVGLFWHLFGTIPRALGGKQKSSAHFFYKI
jgi:hypothetical protein